jgi:bifunctional DNase/RNase
MQPHNRASTAQMTVFLDAPPRYNNRGRDASLVCRQREDNNLHGFRSVELPGSTSRPQIPQGCCAWVKGGLAVPVLMELKRIIINEIHDQQIILLNEVEGDRAFPIVIGMYEVLSINNRVQGRQWPRPMTHDLICTVIDHLGGDLQDIYINELRDHTYFAKLRVRKDGELVEVDCRPSDAIAVAVTAKVPIYVAEDVLEEASEEQ